MIGNIDSFSYMRSFLIQNEPLVQRFQRPVYDLLVHTGLRDLYDPEHVNYQRWDYNSAHIDLNLAY